MNDNGTREMRWVDAWEVLLAISEGRSDYPCVLPDGRVVDAEECKAWLQTTAYEGFVPHIERGWDRGRPAAVAKRTETG
jgi:hypothetical protein